MKNHKKTQTKHLHFLFLFRPFFCFTFSSNIFPFSFITFSFIILFISFWCSLLFLFSLFSILSLLLHFRVSAFFSVSHVSWSFFLHRRFCESSFCFTSFFFSLFCSWSHFSFHTSSLPFFPHLRIFFCWKKIQKYLWSIFLHEIMSLFFEPSLLRCFISCFFPPCVDLIPCLFHVLLIISASWHYFSWFSSINLLFGSLKNNCRFVVGQKFQKISLILFLSLKKLLFFLSFINFCFWICFFMHDLQKHFAIFLCFHILFWKISWFFCLNLLLSVKKNTKKKWLS